MRKRTETRASSEAAGKRELTDETEAVAAGYGDTIRSALDTILQHDPSLAERITQLDDADVDRCTE